MKECSGTYLKKVWILPIVLKKKEIFIFKPIDAPGQFPEVKCGSSPKKDENGEWRRLHNEELHSLYRSCNIVRAIKSTRLRWTGHVARMEKGRSASKFYQVNLQERDL